MGLRPHCASRKSTRLRTKVGNTKTTSRRHCQLCRCCRLSGFRATPTHLDVPTDTHIHTHTYAYTHTPTAYLASLTAHNSLQQLPARCKFAAAEITLQHFVCPASPFSSVGDTNARVGATAAAQRLAYLPESWHLARTYGINCVHLTLLLQICKRVFVCILLECIRCVCVCMCVHTS